MSLSSQKHKLLHLFGHVFFQLIYKCEYTSVYSCDMHSHLDFLKLYVQYFLVKFVSTCFIFFLLLLWMEMCLFHFKHDYFKMTTFRCILYSPDLPFPHFIDNNFFLQTHFDFLGSQGHPIARILPYFLYSLSSPTYPLGVIPFLGSQSSRSCAQPALTCLEQRLPHRRCTISIWQMTLWLKIISSSKNNSNVLFIIFKSDISKIWFLT